HFSHHIFFYYCLSYSLLFFLFFFNDPSTTEIYTLSLHDALPISTGQPQPDRCPQDDPRRTAGVARGCEAFSRGSRGGGQFEARRSEEHTSELQSLAYLVCRLLLEKKKNKNRYKKIKLNKN